MASITLKGTPVSTSGALPSTGKAPAFTLAAADLSPLTNASFTGKRIILNIFPSVDTPTCATSVRKFNAEAASLTDTVVVCVSADLPFAQSRFCGAEGLKNVVTASSFRSTFGSDFGLTITDSKLAGLLARAVVVLDRRCKALRVAYALGGRPAGS
jgi:thioredoxin-dependent peroxiredoxin